jgi:hypothetical protein
MGLGSKDQRLLAQCHKYSDVRLSTSVVSILHFSQKLIFHFGLQDRFGYEGLQDDCR